MPTTHPQTKETFPTFPGDLGQPPEPRYKLGEVVKNQHGKPHTVAGVRYEPYYDEEGVDDPADPDRAVLLRLYPAEWSYLLVRLTPAGRANPWGWVAESEVTKAIELT